LLPTLSCLSVSCVPVGPLRLWPSEQYLRISPLHCSFPLPLTHSSPAVSTAILRLGRRLSPQTYETAYAPFMPSNSEQRLPHMYYRGCWHIFCRGFLWWAVRRMAIHHTRFPPPDSTLQPRGPSSCTRRGFVRLASIAKDSRLQPPVGVWAVSQSQCGRTPSQAGYRSSPWWAVTPPTS
jgi:hypothetical protein